jgi:hypothetical protein
MPDGATKNRQHQLQRCRVMMLFVCRLGDGRRLGSPLEGTVRAGPVVVSTNNQMNKSRGSMRRGPTATGRKALAGENVGK